MTIKTKCRICKRYFKFTGEAYGLCSDKCRKEHKKNLRPSKMFPQLTKELNKIDRRVN